jgi:imidazolonepropionase-like amidohydrolase
MIVFTSATIASADVIAIRDVRLFDGQRTIPKATVVFSDGVIIGAGADVAVPDGAKVIDGSGKTLLPGLIDAHTHVFGDALQRALRFGVTMELDMFTNGDFARAMRRSEPGRADLLSAGTLVTVAGGHGSEYFPIPTFVPGSDAQAFIDARLAEGSDYIKLVYDSGKSFGLGWPTLSKEDLAALIAATHKRGKRAVVHVSVLAAAKEAIVAGADGLVHIFGDAPPDEQFGSLAAKHRIFVIPTLTVVESTSGVGSGVSLIDDSRLAPYLNAEEKQNLRNAFPRRDGSTISLDHGLAAVRQLRAAGVPILAGTDAPNPGTAHGVSMHRELELLVGAGLTPVEALAAATSVPAKAFALEDRGRVVKGGRADLLLVQGDPTKDISATRDIVSVWKSGVLLKRERETAVANASVTLSPEMLASVISDFEGGDAAVAFGGGWSPSTDTVIGGKSTVEMTVVDEGANGSKKSLLIRTDTKPGAPFPWAGAFLQFGPTPMAAVDLSSKSGLTFHARGGVEVRLMVFSRSTGRIPRIKAVQAGADWTELAVTWKDFGIDGKDVQAVLFGGPASGPADVYIDHVQLR